MDKQRLYSKSWIVDLVSWIVDARFSTLYSPDTSTGSMYPKCTPWSFFLEDMSSASTYLYFGILTVLVDLDQTIA